MLRKIVLLGGDLRSVKLAEMLEKDGFEVGTFGLEDAYAITENEKIAKYDTIEEAIQSSSIVIGPIPLSSNGEEINMPFSEKTVTIEELGKKLENKIFVAGSIPEGKEINAKQIIDILKREELTVLNTISTAEGAIQIAMEETARTLHGSKILLMGFGRVSKILANMLKGIGADVYCETTRAVGYSWIKAYGYQPIYMDDLEERLNEFDVIINTIPSIVLEQKQLELVKKDCILIDLASNPGGIDKEAAKKLGLKFIWALSLPGKVAPVTSAEFIRDTLYNILKEIEEEK